LTLAAWIFETKKARHCEIQFRRAFGFIWYYLLFAL